MDRARVVEILTDLKDIRHLSELRYERANLEERAEAIAQAAEEETTGVRGEIEVLANYIMAEVPGEPSQSEGAGHTAVRILTEYQETIADLRAQVAVMTGTLQHIKAEWFDKWYPADIFVGGPDSDEGVNDVVAIREMVVQALSAAPKVVLHEGAKLTGPDEFGENSVWFRHENGKPYTAFRLQLPWRYDNLDAQEVNVFVTERPGKAGCSGHREQPLVVPDAWVGHKDWLTPNVVPVIRGEPLGEDAVGCLPKGEQGQDSEEEE